jgi:membrane fusion protein (multidrug efflux system)
MATGMSRQNRSLCVARFIGAAAAGLLMALFTSGCRVSSAHSATVEENATQPVLAVDAARVAVMPMRQEATLIGTTAAMTHLMVRAPTAGRVLGLSLLSGDRVRRGEVIAHIISREQEAAQAGVDVARQIDPQEAAALKRAVKRYASGTGIPVVAPENGIVAQSLVSPDQIVNYLDPLVDLVDPKSVYIEAQVPISTFGAVKAGMPAVVTSPLSPGKRYPARVVALSPSFATGGTVAPVRVEFTGKQRILASGAAVEVHVTTAFMPDALVIPVAALFRDAARGVNYVFVVGHDDRARRTVISVGIRNPSFVQVTHGLGRGQLVITSGGYAVSDGLRVKPTVTPEAMTDKQRQPVETGQPAQAHTSMRAHQ